MPRQPSPQDRPIITYPVPVITDLMIVDEWNTQDGSYTALQYGSRHPNVSKFSSYFLVKQQPSEKDKWVQRIWVNDPEAEDTYNLLREEFDGEDNSYPTFIRRYDVRRNEYAPLTKGTALTGIVRAKVTAEGSGYTTPPTVTASGTGSGATFQALIFRGAVVWIIVTAQGTGYTGTPTIAITGGGGTGATGTVAIQPATAVLVKEDLIRAEGDPIDSIYIRVQRVYMTLPGATISNKERIRSGVIKLTTKQAIVMSTTPGAGGGATLHEQINGQTVYWGYREIESYVDDSGTPLSANPIFVTQEIIDKDRVVFSHYAQIVPSSETMTSTGLVLNSAYGTGFIWASTAIQSVTVTTSGTAYTAIPTISIGTPAGGVAASLSPRMKAISATVVASGTGRAPGDALNYSGGTSTTTAVFTVATTKVVSATIAAAGTGGVDGAAVVTGTTGTGTKFTANVTISGNAITAIGSIATGGSYTVNPTSISAEPVTGASLTGAQLNVVMGANTGTITTAGSYSVLPSNPISLSAGSVTVTGYWGVLSVTVTSGGSGYTTPFPPLTFSPLGAIAYAVVDSAGWVSATAYVIDGQLKQLEDSPNQLKTWTTSPVPPEKRQNVQVGYEFPAIMDLNTPISREGTRLWPGYDFDLQSHRKATFPALETIVYQRGQWGPASFPSVFALDTPAAASAIIPIPQNCVHEAFTAILLDADAATTYAETYEASSPSYVIGQTITIGAEQSVWRGDIWGLSARTIAENTTLV